MWNWVKTIVDSVFGTKAQDASTQTDPVTPGSAPTASTQTASVTSGAIKAQEAKQKPGADDARKEVDKVRYKDPVIQLVLEKEIIEKLMHIEKEDPIYAQLEKQTIIIFNDRLIKGDTELLNKIDDARKEVEKNARIDAVKQATAKAEEAANTARIVASAIQSNKAPTAIAPEPEGRKVPKNSQTARFNLEGKGDGPEAKKPPTKTHKKVPKNQDLGTDWKKEEDEFMKKAEAEAVKRKQHIEESRKKTQTLLAELVESNQRALASSDDGVNAYAQANNLSQKELEALRERLGKENGLNYSEIKNLRNNSITNRVHTALKEGYRDAADLTLGAKAKASEVKAKASKALEPLKDKVSEALEPLKEKTSEVRSQVSEASKSLEIKTHKAFGDNIYYPGFLVSKALEPFKDAYNKFAEESFLGSKDLPFEEPKPLKPLSPEKFNTQSARPHIHHPITPTPALEPAQESQKTNPTNLIPPQTMKARALTSVKASESRGQNQPGKEGGGVKFALAPKTGGEEIKAKKSATKPKVSFAFGTKNGSNHNLKVPRTNKAGQGKENAAPNQR